MKEKIDAVFVLDSETDFLNYIKLLRRYVKKYCIMIASADTPCGPYFTKEMAYMLMDLGFKINLYDKYRCSYVGILDCGKLVFEEVSATEVVQTCVMIGEDKVEMLSAGFNVPYVNNATIKINGKNHSPGGGRGLSFVIFDKENNSVLDAVTFDTYSQNFICHRPSQIRKGVEKYVLEHPEVSLIGFSCPAFPTENLTENERFILDNAVGRGTILSNLDKPVFAINKYYNAEEIVELLCAPKSYHDINGVRRFEDMIGKRVSIRGGHRVTVNQPKNPKKTIYIIGGCGVFGVGAADEHTIASFLQDLLNETFPEFKICVQNYGFFLAELKDAQTNEVLKILNSLPVKNGDIVLCNFSVAPGMPFINLSQISNEERDFEIFTDMIHLTPHGYVLMAHKIFEGLMSLNLLNDKDEGERQEVYGFNEGECNELAEYKKELTEFYNEMFTPTIGSIVMNCNPFTLGHRYLIEEALKQCDYLAIFVVQEDKSVFPFEDRMRLVSEGVADLQNIMVIPSGRFIISSLTFSEYFNKSEMQERVVDTSMDIVIFAKEIAPCLHITKRFAGEEPFDKVTKQYNESMKSILPEYGIEFVEIPRKRSNDEVISASRVRKLLEERDFSAVKELVPDSTFKYLIENYNN